jgi:hypothetical protein
VPAPDALTELPRRWRRRRGKNFDVDPWREAGKLLRGQLYWDRGAGYENTILLAGQGRSGTTWVSEIVNYRNEYRVVDEPFHPGRLALTRPLPPRPYLRPDDEDPRYLDPARAIFSGRVRSLWVDRYNRRFLPARRLIKETRANLLLPWIHRQFPSMPIVLLIRHPCAVVASQFRLAQRWPVNLSRFLAQPALMEDHLEPFRTPMEAAAVSVGEDAEWDRHVFAWCIDQYVPMRHFGPGQIHMAHYEHFVTDPPGETRRLFGALNKTFDAGIEAALARPSATAQKGSPVQAGLDQVNRWKRDISPDRVQRAMAIVRLFGLEVLYGEEGMPVARAGSFPFGGPGGALLPPGRGEPPHGVGGPSPVP